MISVQAHDIMLIKKGRLKAYALLYHFIESVCFKFMDKICEIVVLFGWYNC